MNSSDIRSTLDYMSLVSGCIMQILFWTLFSQNSSFGVKNQSVRQKPIPFG